MNTGDAVLLVVGVLAVGNVPAQSQSSDHASHRPAAAAAPSSQASDSVDGEVRRVDSDAKTLTPRRAPIPNPGMTETTVVFQVTDTAMPEGLKTGDMVRFRAERVGGQLTVVAVQPAQ